VRATLVPALMKLAGETNWWAPAPLRRFQERFGLHEAPADDPSDDVIDLDEGDGSIDGVREDELATV